MALINKINRQQQSVNTLTLKEYEFLFEIIKNSTFKGENLELLYNLTLKLQDQYLYVRNNKT